jgi:hypothetical protein
MNSLLERGLRTAVSVLADALDSSPVRDMRPQQFDPSERTPRNRRRARRTEDELEADPIPEEERRRRPKVAVEAVTSQRTRDLRGQLRDRAGVRRAFLLMELLDRPRALRPYRPHDD